MEVAGKLMVSAFGPSLGIKTFTPHAKPQHISSTMALKGRVFHLLQFTVSNPLAAALLYGLLALYAGSAAALDFSNSKWIWIDNSENVPAGAIGDFRYDLTPPAGQIASSAEILIAADNNYTLFVNGEYIGSGNNWEQGQAYCVTLDPECNVFAVEVHNRIQSPAALISAIQVTYTDTTTETIVTDSTWRANGPTPGFQAPGYSDAGWLSAVVLGNANSPPWITPSTPPTSGSSLTISNSYWIWTNEVTSPTSNAPAGHRAFRKTINLPIGQLASTGTIVIDADNAYTLYINGNLIGSSGDWEVAQRWTFTLDSPTDNIVIAVDATNTIPSPAGLIAAIALDVESCYCSTYDTYITDSSWKYSLTVPPGFQQPFYNDADWPNAFVEGTYGVQPWGTPPIVNA